MIVAIKQPRIEVIIFKEANNISVSRKRAMDSKLKEEKVVNPPRIPMVRNIFNDGSEINFSSSIVIRKPMAKQPIRLTKRVPKGKLAGKILCIAPDSQYLKDAPMPPPVKTRK